MKTIGGYIGMVELKENCYHKNALKLNTGRNCLRHLIRTKKIETIFLPRYICDSVINVCKEEKCNIKFYNIDNLLRPLISRKINKNDYVYFVNYYGLFDNKYINNLKKKYNNLIVDNVQDFFKKPIKDVDIIYSCRKFFGVSDGAYLYTNETKTYDEDTSLSRMKHVLGSFEKDISEYYGDFLKNEKNLEKECIKNMSKITNNFLNMINYGQVKNRRTKNFKYLNNYLKNSNKLKIKTIEGAYMYPYYVENGAYLKNELIKEKIFVPTLWPNVLKENEENTFEYDLANNTVLLPVDQRYDIIDMEKIIKIIKEKEK